MEFTKEEISLCKQVAEKYRKYIEYGSWFLNAWGKVSCACGYSYPVNRPVRRENENPKWIALWTISDCLEFLAERGLWIIGFQQDEDEWSVGFAETDELGMRALEETQKWTDGETPLEACLKAVLAVLEEE